MAGLQVVAQEAARIIIDHGVRDYRVAKQKAAERLGIKTVAITEMQDRQGSLRKAVPYAAVLYDPNGKTWVYTMRQPLTYIREPITLESVEDDMAILSKGPEVETTVVSIGIAMLYGVEYGVGQ